jgi:hypothetical protein
MLRERNISSFAQKPEISTQHGINRSSRPADDDDDGLPETKAKWAEPRRSEKTVIFHFFTAHSSEVREENSQTSADLLLRFCVRIKNKIQR